VKCSSCKGTGKRQRKEGQSLTTRIHDKTRAECSSAMSMGPIVCSASSRYTPKPFARGEFVKLVNDPGIRTSDHHGRRGARPATGRHDLVGAGRE